MIEGDSFVMAGWVLSLRVHIYKQPAGVHWLVMGKRNNI